MKYKISVIIPVYNAESTIRRCVESIIYGNFKDLEVILVDDYSSDGSWSICREYESRFPFVTAIRNDQNRGVSYTRNHGLDISRGEFILFVDSDDWVSCNYATALYSNANLYSDSLVMCGFHFIDYTQSYSHTYLFDNKEILSIVPKKDFIRLMDCVHLQVVWNKIFRREIIRLNNIRFDENQSMGEDFQFVLDYLEKASIQTCVVVNQELLYYIRYNGVSLMKNFSTTPFNLSKMRMMKLAQICGMEESIGKLIVPLQENQTYQIVRNTSMTRNEKISAIESLWNDGSGKKRYYRQKLIFLIECMNKKKSDVVKIPGRMHGRIQRVLRQKRVNQFRQDLRQSGFTIISQNCIGGVFYHDMGLPFDSPTINLYFDAADYLRFVNNLRYYMSLPLEMQWGEEYPIGMLGDVKIYFMHYDTCKEAFESWNRRAQRIHWDKIVVLDTDRNGFGEQEYSMWRNISYPKLLFTVHPDYNKDSVLFPEYEDMGYVPDLIPKREFYRDEKLLKLINSL